VFDAAAPPDDLRRRSGLPEAYAWLEREYPRSDWPKLRLHAAARIWLQRHDWFRTAHLHLQETGRAWRDAGADPRAYAREAIPPLAQFLQHLDGHHRIESEAYFPAMGRQEPRMTAGFALLDRDHDLIHGLLQGMADAANALGRGITAGADARPAAERLADVIGEAGAPLLRHLHDEEDIVVPMLTRHGDPLELANH
jgi:iron-sulfur cluster repair protein YtfE (RIC family)